MIYTLIDDFDFIRQGDGALKSAVELLVSSRQGEVRRILLNGEKIKCANYMHEIWVADQVRKVCSSLGVIRERRGNLIIAAILHDLYEDFNISDFGCSDEVSKIVFEVSKNHSAYNGYVGMSEDAMILKTSDRLVNLTTCVGVFSTNKIQNYHLDTEIMIESFISSGTDIGKKCGELLKLGIRGELKYGNDFSM